MAYSEREEQLMSEAVERALRLLPSVMSNLIKQSATLKSLSDKFYEQNKDLAGEKELVAKLMETEEAQNPGIGFDKLLEKVAPKVRQSLGQELGKLKGCKPSVAELDESLNGVV